MSPLAGRAGLVRGTVFLAVLIVAPLVFAEHWLVNLLFFTVLYAAMSVAWNLVGGFAGYPSLGHAAFFGIGAYATAFIYRGTDTLSTGYEPFLVLVPVGLAVAVLAVPIGAIAMRTRADVFAIVTITFLFVVQTLAFNLPGLTGGSQGVAVAPAPFALDTFELPFYYAAATLLVVAMSLGYGVLRSKAGLALTAVRVDEDKARGIGVPTAVVKLLAFAVSAGLTAVAGGIGAYYVGFLYSQFAVDPLITISVVLMTFLGGRATLWGPVLGAVILMPAQQLLAYYVGAGRLYLVGYAAVFLVIMLVLPRGILPSLQGKRRSSALTASGEPAVVAAEPEVGVGS